MPWRKGVIDEDVRFADGLMYPSDRPGLGVELNEEAAAKHPKADTGSATTSARSRTSVPRTA